MDDTKRLLLVGESESGLSPFVRDIVGRGWDVRHASDFGHANEVLDETPCDVGLAYLDFHQFNGQTETERFLSSTPLEWIALIDQPTLDRGDICHMLRQLFYAYHTLPVDAEQIDCLLTHAMAMSQLSLSTSGGDTLPSHEYEMVGTTPVMQKLFNTIRRVAAVDAPVFISGESGTGKELAARAIHERSQRADGPFIAVNCGALPSNLIQSELFGHEKGAFTGASQRKTGRIEAAQGGTLFLDEIGDLPLDMQVNLLRFLEDHHIQRVGGLKEIPVDVRILAATHVDLDKAVQEGSFREDLYHRLNVLQVKIPALRERQEDIEVLARFFFDKFSDEKSLQVKGFSQESLALMRHYDWPGNIRELINRVRRAMVMCENRLIRPIDLGLERRKSTRHAMTLEQARDNAEHEAIKAALARNKYKIQNAAKDLGVSRVTLYRLMDKHSIGRQQGTT
ncbi:sigma-54-dependent Fis family transcriptional regulator [Litchfieldella qijiaojingensis]|uniref:Sigma-54-dependent Fis family transcriptional regulator n=1 Tax=Litchfieldella qijiaojingensis TaxID=980347 RepID=A0ABQ2YJ05_9GAMM|nr:sigma-54 dependent transcriptional regulator [Halomonas qijiaojingensis]GGX83680.1 sigma-54-dependent Fis family transcriptional regulator [Halomonas qijiaojingensis]